MDSPSTLQFVGTRSSFLLRIFDIAIIAAALMIMMHSYNITFNKDYLLVLIGVLFFYSYIGESLGLYRSWRSGRFSTMCRIVCLNVTFAFVLMTLLLFVFKYSEVYSRVTVGGWYVLTLLSLVTWRLCVREIKRLRRKKGYSVQKIAIVGLTEAGQRLYEQIQKHDELGFECVGFYDDRDPHRIENLDLSCLKGTINDAVDVARRGEIQKLYVCLPMIAEQRTADIILALGDSTVDVLITPDFLLKNLMHARIGSVGEVDTLSVFESPVNGMMRFYKRSFDLVFSFAALVVLSPLLFVIALAVKLNSQGPIIFKQDRYGLDGRKIKVWKFRSMTVTENSNVVIQAKKGDARITSIGGFLRKSSLDELPQFFNVLMGDMSVVGPRPHAIAHNEEYRHLVSYYMLRHKVLPGITGWAQINGWRGETDTLDKMEKRIEFDLAYIRNWSIWLDVKIVFMTCFKGFAGKHVY